MPLERWLYTVPLRLRSLFRRERVEQELEEELQYHLERKMENTRRRVLLPSKRGKPLCARWTASRNTKRNAPTHGA